MRQLPTPTPMTDHQKETLYKQISDWDDFNKNIESKTDIKLKTVTIQFDHTSSLVKIVFPQTIQTLSSEQFQTVLNEFRQQRTSDLNFQEKIKNRVSDMEFNIDHEAKTFRITDTYVMNLTYASDISSAQTWYKQQLQEALRLFDKNYQLLYKDQVIKTKEEFVKMFFPKEQH
jgi:hypothetical protein